MFTEGFSERDQCDGRSALVLNFRGIPEGVTVTASLTGTGEATEVTVLEGDDQLISAIWPHSCW